MPSSSGGGDHRSSRSGQRFAATAKAREKLGFVAEITHEDGLKRTVETGQVKQSFSHGRSNTVVVEVKKRRFVGKPGESEAVVEAPVVVEAAPAAPVVAPVVKAPPAPPAARPMTQLERREQQERERARGQREHGERPDGTPRRAYANSTNLSAQTIEVRFDANVGQNLAVCTKSRIKAAIHIVSSQCEIGSVCVGVYGRTSNDDFAIVLNR